MKHLSAIGVLLILSGCVSTTTVPVSQNTTAQLKGQNLVLTQRQKPDFAAMTAGSAMFAIVGAIAMISAGNEIVRNNNIDDPANAISAALSNEATQRYGMLPVAKRIAVTSGDEAEISKVGAPVSRYVLDIETRMFGFGYFPTDWTHYRPTYSAKARLIDAQSNTLVAEGFCSYFPDSNVGAPTYDEMLANQAATLKNMLSKAADECVKLFKKDMLLL